MLPKISFSKLSAPSKGTLVVFADDALNVGPTASAVLSGADGLLARAAATGGFTGKINTVLDLIAPAGLELDRLVVVGLGKASAVADLGETDWSVLGGVVMDRTLSGLVFGNAYRMEEDLMGFAAGSEIDLLLAAAAAE